MILPIVAYGDPVLKRVAKPIDASYPNLTTLIENMFETMYNANGVGLAAPQINLSIRLFIVDTEQMLVEEDEKSEFADEVGIKQVFINAEVLETSGTPWVYKEGCLSIPTVSEDVRRDETVKIKYQDADFNEHVKTFSGITARVILHEYDHIEGVLFTELISNLKKRLLKGKLAKISKGEVEHNYRMRFTNSGKRR